MTRARLLLATLAAYLPAAALPEVAGRVHVDPAVLVVPFCLGFAAGFPLWGRAVDRSSPRRVIRLALLAAGLAGVLVAVAHGAVALSLARLVQGLAAAGVPPAAQAALAARASGERTGRALSGMMLAVALATLGGPALAPVLASGAGWTATAVVLGAAPALLLAFGGKASHYGTERRTGDEDAGAERRASPPAEPYADPRGVRAGWLVSALVLGGHWTVLTRLTDVLGDRAGAAALTGVAGLPLVLLAARASDRGGPRRTMTLTLLAGGAGFAAAAGTGGGAAFVATAGVGLAVYWAYLPVVAAQVQLSAGPEARGRAAGGLYASMWLSAAIAGGAAAIAPTWQSVLLGAGALWALGALVAAKTFIGARWPAWLEPQPSPS